MKLIKKQNAEHRTQSTDKNRESLMSEVRDLCSVSEHGGNIYKISEELGIPAHKLIDFSASINPLGISEKVKEAIHEEMDNLVNYPDPDTTALRRMIAGHHNIDAGTIICGNGSTELIYLIPRALQPRNVLITAPAFSEYERACLMNDELRVKSYELKKGGNFAIVPTEFIKAMQGCELAFLCNPNNPTGRLLSKKEVLEIADAAKKRKCFLVVDEAFIDFTPEESVIEDVRENPYLIVLRSMTKFYALTGLRVGYGVFHTDLIHKIREFKEPWTVNNLAQKAAVAAFGDSEYSEETFRLMKREKEFIETCLKENDIEYSPSSANYYLLRIKGAGSAESRLRRKGILVRDCTNFKGLDDSYIRIAVKSRRENAMLLKELLKS